MLPDRAAEPNMQSRIPLFIAGFGASATGVIALSAATTDTAFTLLILVLLAAGFCVSYMVRAGMLSGSTVAGAALMILVSALAAIFAAPDARYVLFPPEVLRSTDLILAAMLAWLMVVHSFSLRTDTAVLFECVPSLSLIGLVATFESSTQALTCFVVFLALACFVAIRQNALSDRKSGVGAAGSVKVHMGLTARVTLMALAAGVLIGYLFYPLLARELFSPTETIVDVDEIVGQLLSEEFVPVATGPVTLSEREVMRVRCEKSLLWRGRTFNKYTGEGWANSLSRWEKTIIWPKGTKSPGEVPHSDLEPSWYTLEIPEHLSLKGRLAVEPVEQTIHITNGWFRAIFAAPEVQKLTINIPRSLVKSGAWLETTIPYTRDTEYKVVSLVSTATPRQLRRSPHEPSDYPEYIRANYLETPQSCWQVEKLTRRITAGQINPFGKALAIQRYLEANCTYDPNTPAVPANEDVVGYFLLKSRRGYCDVFASSMVIMCRQVGIPARWATGFATGRYSEEDSTYQVRAKDRHAWAELYFPSYGWIPFDPAPAGTDSRTMARLHELWTSAGQLLSFYGPSTLIAGLILLLVGHLFRVELIDRLSGKRRGHERQPSILTTKIAENYRRMCELLSRFGYPRHHAVTPWEYAAELDRLFRPRLEPLSAAVNSITADFIEIRYAARELPPERTTAATDALSMLVRHLKAARRQKLLPQRQAYI